MELIGQTIKDIRRMTAKEQSEQGWDWVASALHSQKPTVIVLGDGTKLFASQDEEGNGPGTMFGTAPDGSGFALG